MEKLTKTNFVKNAEDVILSLRVKDKRSGKVKINITTSKIRNLLAMSNNLMSRAEKESAEKLSEDVLSDIQYMKMKFAYEAGRDQRIVKDFIDKANIMQYIDTIGESREELLLFCKYMESLVAYHKFYGGRER